MSKQFLWGIAFGVVFIAAIISLLANYPDFSWQAVVNLLIAFYIFIFHRK